MTPKAVTSNYCKGEICFASSLKKPIFPLVLEDSFSSMRGGIKTILQRIQWIDMAPSAEFQSKIAILVDNIKRVGRDRRKDTRDMRVDWGKTDRGKVPRRLSSVNRRLSSVKSPVKWTKISKIDSAQKCKQITEKLDVYICCHESATQAEVVHCDILFL